MRYSVDGDYVTMAAPQVETELVFGEAHTETIEEMAADIQELSMEDAYRLAIENNHFTGGELWA